MNRIIKQTLKTFILLTSITFSTNFAYANELTTENTIEKELQYVPITINYLLDGVNIKLKSSKILDNEIDFCDNFTIKLTNNLSNGSIDVQEKIRNYYFSHYEINGKRIESIDSIITLAKDNSVINVIYSEDDQKDGYLRKGFKNGIGIDYDYLSYASENNSSISTELYDETWSILLPTEYCDEITNLNQDLKNANDQTLYLKANTSPLSTKEETDLTKKYNYIDSIKITTSLGYSNLTNDFSITYKPIDTILDLNEKLLTLNGLNLEGKIEELSKEVFKNGEITFTINKNTNNYQYLFIAMDTEDSLIENNQDKTEDSLQEKPSNTVIDVEQDKKQPSETTITSNIQNNESFIVTTILISFSIGAISTFILSLIISTRNKNIEKKAKKCENKE